MEPDVARFVHLHQVDHQRRDDARHQGQDVREQRPHLVIGRPAGAVALWVVALRAALLAVARLAVARRVRLAVALRAVLAVVLRAVLRVSGVVHGGTSPFLGPRRSIRGSHRTEWRSPLASASSGTTAGPARPRPGPAGHRRRMVASHACASSAPNSGLTSKASATMAVTAQPSLKAVRSSSWRTRRGPVVPGWRSLKHIR